MTRPKNVVLVFPHQDDEMYIFHRIRYLLKHGARLTMVWMTDGAANNIEVRQDPSIRLFFPVLTRESDTALRQIRKRESTSLMRHLGIPERNLRFLSYPSGQIKGCFSHIVTSLARVFSEVSPQEIYTVAFDHCEFEHDVCNAAVKFAANAWAGKAMLYEFPVFNTFKSRPRLHWFIPHKGVRIERTRFSQREEAERLRLFQFVFKSQWPVAMMEKISYLLPSDYKRHGEPYRIMPEYDYTQWIKGAWVTYMPKSLRLKDFREMILGHLRQGMSGESFNASV
jgi:LmbE family N-acetylglucosaminyl deacetylase